MSARDSESGSSTYKGGSGRAGGLGNGGIGGGMGGGGNYGGGMGGGAGRNGGIGSRTGLTTGNRMIGGVATGRSGGMAFNPGAWGIRQSPISRNKKATAAVPGLLGPAVPVADENILAVEEVPPYTPNVFNQDYLKSLADFRKMMNSRYGWGSAVPGPSATYTGATGYWSRNPTSFPQHARDWEKGQWAENSIYGGMAPAPNKAELSNRNWRGPRQDIGAMTGGQGVPGFSSSGAPGFGGYR